MPIGPVKRRCFDYAGGEGSRVRVEKPNQEVMRIFGKYFSGYNNTAARKVLAASILGSEPSQTSGGAAFSLVVRVENAGSGVLLCVTSFEKDMTVGALEKYLLEEKGIHYVCMAKGEKDFHLDANTPLQELSDGNGNVCIEVLNVDNKSAPIRSKKRIDIPAIAFKGNTGNSGGVIQFEVEIDRELYSPSFGYTLKSLPKFLEKGCRMEDIPNYFRFNDPEIYERDFEEIQQQGEYRFFLVATKHPTSPATICLDLHYFSCRSYLDILRQPGNGAEIKEKELDDGSSSKEWISKRRLVVDGDQCLIQVKICKVEGTRNGKNFVEYSTSDLKVITFAGEEIKKYSDLFEVHFPEESARNSQCYIVAKSEIAREL